MKADEPGRMSKGNMINKEIYHISKENRGEPKRCYGVKKVSD